MNTPNIAVDSNTSNDEPEIQSITDKSQVSGIKTKNTKSSSAVVTNTKSISQHLSALTSSIKEKLKPGVDKSLQDELAALLNLMHEIGNSYYEHFTPLIEIAIESLLSEKPNLPLAQGIRKGVEANVHRSTLEILRRGGSPATHVIRGLGTLLFTLIPLPILAALITQAWIPKLVESYDRIFGSNATELVLLVAIAGAVGSAISIMVRIQEYEPLKETDPTILFLIGLFKPIIGVAFALFVFTVLKSQLIPVQVVTPNEFYFYTALAFVAGFSERFAKDIVARAEDALSNDQSSTAKKA